MNYADAKKYLYSDGSYRDIYVFDTSSEDLDRFIRFVRPRLRDDSFLVNGEISKLPMSYSEVLEKTKEQPCLLGIPVGDFELNCHFFDESEIELDLDPKQYDSETQWEHLDRFLSELSSELGKDVILTPENEPTEIYFRYRKRAEPAASENGDKSPPLS